MRLPDAELLVAVSDAGARRCRLLLLLLLLLLRLMLADDWRRRDGRRCRRRQVEGLRRKEVVLVAGIRGFAAEAAVFKLESFVESFL